jgi:protein-arginine kinase activator protein McsA
MLLLKKVKDIKAIRSDNGSEFIADVFKDFLKKKNIKQVLSSPNNPQSNGGIERFNQTLKRLIKKQLELKDGYNWVMNLQKLVDNINNTVIDGIGKSPNEIERDASTHEEVYEKDKKIKANSIAKQKYEEGDNVRIYIEDDGKWSNDIYEISKVIKPKNEYSVYEYKLVDEDKKYFEEDLQKIIDVQNRIDVVEKFEISKFVRPVVKNNKEHYEVAWKGYRKKSDNTIEPRTQLLKDAPKILHRYEKSINWKRDRNNKLYFTIDKDKCSREIG